MAAPRPVRIPRASPTPRAAMTAGDLVEHRPNEAGTQRAFRFAVFYVLALVVLDATLVLFDLSSPVGREPGSESGLGLFTAFALVLAVGSVLFALSPAPRHVDFRTDGVVVVGRWGHRRWFPVAGDLNPKVVRHYPAGLLSSRPVDIVELVDRTGHRRNYQVDAGLFAPPTGTNPP
ncbi:MAG: hypothetical protein L3K10_00920 [Thermoplasmata archaeon]|nr:hypothetical protein [Thermoplasmata archaeon]